jgi:tRNA-specific 2-thiouridylase
VKIRYLSEPVPAAVKPFGIGIYEVKFEKPLKAVTPGQYAVFYEGDMLLGGGEIC